MIFWRLVFKYEVKIDNSIFHSIKVENGKITIRDGMGNEFSLTVEYGDFGEI